MISQMRLPLSALAFSAALAALPQAALGADYVPYDSLAGTVWLSQKYHTRTTINTAGEAAYKEGKRIYLKFLEQTDGVYTVQVHWWNESAGIHVVEYGVLVQAAENEYTYIEPEHPEDSGFPGIAGYGTFELVDAETAEYSQLGRLADGSASGFVVKMKRVENAPEIPVPQTYPSPD